MWCQQPFFDQARQIFKLNVLQVKCFKCENPVTAHRPCKLACSSNTARAATRPVTRMPNPPSSTRPCAAGSDQGLTFGVLRMFAPELKAKTVKTVLTDWSLPPVEAWAIFPAGRQTSAKARTFASFIQSQMLNRDRFQQQMGAEN